MFYRDCFSAEAQLVEVCAAPGNLVDYAPCGAVAAVVVVAVAVALV